MANYYDPQQMQAVASNVSKKAQVFHTASETIQQIISQLSAEWNDPVNQKFSQHYLREGAEKEKELEKYIKSYADIMSHCSAKFGKAIDDGNTFFNSF